MGNDLKWPVGADSRIIFGLSNRSDGNMRPAGYKGEEDRRILDNRRKFFNSLGVSEKNVVFAGLAHGNGVTAVTARNGGCVAENTDALITDAPGTVLAVTVADCVPVYFYDPATNAVGIAHAGWKGVEKGIPAVVVANMARTFGTKPADLLVHVGPCIQQHHFEVKEDVAEKFSAYPRRTARYKDRVMVDLSGVIFDQLAALGVGAKNVTLDHLCTYCEKPKYFSYRRDRPIDIEAMVAYIGVK